MMIAAIFLAPVVCLIQDKPEALARLEQARLSITTALIEWTDEYKDGEGEPLVHMTTRIATGRLLASSTT